MAGVHTAPDPVGGAVPGGILAGDAGPIPQVLGKGRSEGIDRGAGIHHRLPYRRDRPVPEAGAGGGGQPDRQPAPLFVIPDRGAEPFELLPGDDPAGGRSNRILQIVRLVDDQVEAVGQARVRGKEGMVEDCHVGVPQCMPGAAVEIKLVEQAAHGARPVDDTQLPAEEPQRRQPTLDRGGAEIGPVAARRLRHPAAEDRQRHPSGVVGGAPIRLLVQSGELCFQGLQADVVLPTLQDHPGEWPDLVPEILQSGQDLVLENARVGGDDCHPAGGPSHLDGGNQVGQRLAGSGRRLDHGPLAWAREGPGDQTGHLRLLRSRRPSGGHQGASGLERLYDLTDVESAGGFDGSAGDRSGNHVMKGDRLSGH